MPNPDETVGLVGGVRAVDCVGGWVSLIGGVGLVGTELETRFAAVAFLAADLPETFAVARFFPVAAFVTFFRLAAATGLVVFLAALTGFGVFAAFIAFFFAGADFLLETFALEFAGLLFAAAFFFAVIALGFDLDATFFVFLAIMGLRK